MKSQFEKEVQERCDEILADASLFAENYEPEEEKSKGIFGFLEKLFNA